MLDSPRPVCSLCFLARSPVASQACVQLLILPGYSLVRSEEFEFPERPFVLKSPLQPYSCTVGWYIIPDHHFCGQRYKRDALDEDAIAIAIDIPVLTLLLLDEQ